MREVALTWTKTGNEFAPSLAELEVSDRLYRAHHEVISYLYELEKHDLRFKASRLHKIITTDEVEEVVEEALALGLWRRLPRSGEYLLWHHSHVVKASLAAQTAKRRRDRDSASSRRNKGSDQHRVGGGVGDDVATYTATTQTDSLSLGSDQQEEVTEKGEENAGARANEVVLASDQQRPARIKRQPVTLPSDFSIDEKMRQWAAKTVPGLDIDWEHGAFISSALANNRRYHDWRQAWQGWMRNQFSGKFGPPRMLPGHSNTGLTKSDERALRNQRFKRDE